MPKSILTERDKNEVSLHFRELLDSCRWCQDEESQQKIKSAFLYAHEAHKDMRRKTGEAFILHPIQVARIVGAEIGLGTTSVVSALLHDVVEDTDHTLEDISNYFGSRVALIVEGLTKITKVSDDNSTLQAENFKKMLLTIPEDIRVIFIKIADRLHNMRTLSGMSTNKQLSKASETLHVFAPLAGKLGLHAIKTELENLGFKYSMPEEYENFEKKILETQDLRQHLYRKFKEILKPEFDRYKIKYIISPKPKSRYITWKKRYDEKIKFDGVSDFLYFRIVFKANDEFDERTQCYQIYSIVTQAFHVNEKTLVDLIRRPHSSGYEALHATVMVDGRWIDIQILTQRMNDIAKKGIYVYGISGADDNVNKLNGNSNGEIIEHSDINGNSLEEWVQQLGEQIKNKDENAINVLNNVIHSIYAKEIYVYTPKGKILQLPKEATVLDFAFSIHSELGYKCAGANVNRISVGRAHVLQSCDQVEIITTENSEPDASWLNIVKTQFAKDQLKNYFKKVKDKKIAEGKALIEEIVNDYGGKITNRIMKRLKEIISFDTIDDLYFKVGSGYISREILTKNLHPHWFQNFVDVFKGTGENKHQSIDELFNSKTPIVISEDLDPELFSFADCCKPLPGDSSVAFNTGKGSVEIHAVACDTAVTSSAIEGNHTVRVVWKPFTKRTFLSGISIGGVDRQGLVADVVNIISNKERINMHKLDIVADNGIFSGIIGLYVHNVDDLKKLIADLLQVEGVSQVERVFKF